jgi:hypothetical protein
MASSGADSFSPMRPVPSRTLLHGRIPPPGVWDEGGIGMREQRNSAFSTRFIAPMPQGGQSMGDFLAANSFFSNGAQSQEGVTSKDLHLGMDLIPLQHPVGVCSPMARVESTYGAAKRPGMRLSAIEFDDREWCRHYPATPDAVTRRVPDGN